MHYVGEEVLERFYLIQVPMTAIVNHYINFTA